MRDLHNVGKYAARRKRNRIWRSIVTGIAGVVVFCTTYALILPAITLETQGYVCGQEGHTHGPECYQLTCGLEEIFSHTHSDECYDGQTLICTLEERTVHHHTASCYSQPTPICGQEAAEAHTHTTACSGIQPVLVCGQEEAQAHAHSDACYTDGVLTCALAETPGHTHSDSCYQEQSVLLCGKAETQGHTHTEECYPADFEPELICGQEDIPEHRHSEECYVLVCEKTEHIHSESCVDNQEAFLQNLSELGAQTGSNVSLMSASAGANGGVMLLSGDSVSIQSLTSISAQDTSYNPATNTFSTTVSVDCEFPAPTDGTKAVEPGKVYTYTYPAGVQLPAGLLEGHRKLQDIAYNYAGEYFFTESNGVYTVNLVFDQEYVDGKVQVNQPVRCFVTFSGEFSAESFSGDRFTVGSGTESIPITGNVLYPENSTETYDIRTEKSGAWDQSSNTLSYTVYIRTTKGTPNPISFTDTMAIPEGLSLGTPTVKVEKGTTRHYPNWDYDVEESWTEITVSPTAENGSLSMELPGLNYSAAASEYSETDTYRITYSYPITDQTAASLSTDNAVSVVSKDENKGQEVKDSAQTSVSTTKDVSYTLDKSGAVASDREGYIKWTVTVNNNSQDLTKSIVTDLMLKEVQNDSDISVSPADNVTVNRTTGQITFSAGEGGTNQSQYTITYYTPVEVTWDSVTKQNTAVLIPDRDNPEDKIEKNADVTVHGVQLGKDGSHNVVTDQLDWTITVNAGGLDIAGATLTDEVFRSLTQAGFTIEPADGYTFIKEGDTITGITFSEVAEGKNTQSYTITYSTAIPENQTEVSNTATLTPRDGVLGNPIPAEKTILLEEPSLTKTGQYDSYNQKINWTIIVNQNGKNIAGAELTDSMLGLLTQDGITVKKNGSWDTLPQTSGEYTITTDDVTGLVTKITFNSIGDTGVNTSWYEITYSAPALQKWDAYVVNNSVKLTLNGKDISESGEVPVPGNGELTKGVDYEGVTQDGTTATVPWVVTLNVPAGGLLEGTVVIDNVTKNQWGNVNENQYLTQNQADALKNLTMTWLDGEGHAVGTISLQESWITFTGDAPYREFKITFPQAIVPPAGAVKLVFTYYTTCNVADTPIGQTKYYNDIKVGNQENGGEYVYTKPGVVKTDGNNSASPSTVTSEGELTWKIKATVGEGNSSFTLLDTLPEGVTLQSLRFTDWTGKNNMDLPLTIGEDGTISGADANYTVIGSIQNRDVNLTVSPNGGGTFQAGEVFTLVVTCQVNDAANVTGSAEFTNSAKMTLDGQEFGPVSQTQSWTYQRAAASVVSKSGGWSNDDRQLNYQVILNPNGEDLVPGVDVLTMTDVLEYYSEVLAYRNEPYHQITVPLTVNLVQSSVKLYDTTTATETSPGTRINDLVWTNSVSNSEWDAKYKISTITLENVPDGVPLLLQYSYRVSSEAPEGYTFNLSGARIQNSATLAGENTGSIPVGNDAVWSDQTSSGGVHTTAALTLTKVDAGNNGKTLPGAVFTVYAYDMESGTPLETPEITYTTGDDGVISVRQGDETDASHVFAQDVLYVLVETTAPRGYVLPDQAPKFYFYFSSGADLPAGKSPTDYAPGAIDLNKTGNVEIVPNEKIPTTEIEVEKQWKDKNGNTLSNPSTPVTIHLYRKTTPGSSSGSSGGDVQVSFNVYKGNGEWGDYACQENVTCPSGTVFTFTLSSWGTPRITANGVELTCDSSTGTGPYQYVYTYQADVNTAIGGYVGDGNEGQFSYTRAEPTTPDPGNSGNGNFSTDDATLVGSIELSNTYGWSHTFTDLPITGLDENNQTVTYYYYVVEEPVANYETSYDVNGIQSGKVVVTNKTVENPSYTLPATGGLGTTPYTLGGLLLVLLAAIPLIYRSTRRRKGGSG